MERRIEGGRACLGLLIGGRTRARVSSSRTVDWGPRHAEAVLVCIRRVPYCDASDMRLWDPYDSVGLRGIWQLRLARWHMLSVVRDVRTAV
jgi:hypothetical protein